MTAMLVVVVGFFAVYAVYIAALTERTSLAETDFLDGGASLPGWAVVFAGAGVVIAGLGLSDQLVLTRRFGLQASHVALGLTLAALTAVIVQKRLWIAIRVTSIESPGEMLGRYYQSVTLRLVMLTLAFLFALPFSAMALARLGDVVEGATGGAIDASVAIWTMGFFLFLAAVIGGWRATVLVVAMQAVLLAVLVPFIAGFSEAVLKLPGFLSAGIPVAEGILADRIPGVVQYSVGIGKEAVQGGLWTTVAIASAALSLVGLVLSPGFLYLGMMAREGRAFAFGPVWMIAGLASGLLIFVTPFIAARIGGGTGGFLALVGTLASYDVMAATCFVLLLVVAAQITISFFTNSGTLLITQELLIRYVLPGLSSRDQKLTARIALAVAYLLIATLASFAPLGSEIFGTLALPMSAQLLPALLGLTFVPWISRSAVLAGLVIGGLLVLFTEPLGLVLFEGLFVDLPWGRWPLTVHSAAWGLAFNFAAVLLVSIFTRSGAERDHRDRLHSEFATHWPVDFGGRVARGAKWSLTLIWVFLAIGPGAILGNTLFSRPIFSESEAALGIPSLWVWQMLFWLIGVPLVWWLAYPSRLGFTSREGMRYIELGEEPAAFERGRAPAWIARGLARVTER